MARRKRWKQNRARSGAVPASPQQSDEEALADVRDPEVAEAEPEEAEPAEREAADTQTADTETADTEIAVAEPAGIEAARREAAQNELPVEAVMTPEPEAREPDRSVVAYPEVDEPEADESTVDESDSDEPEAPAAPTTQPQPADAVTTEPQPTEPQPTEPQPAEPQTAGEMTDSGDAAEPEVLADEGGPEPFALSEPVEDLELQGEPRPAPEAGEPGEASPAAYGLQEPNRDHAATSSGPVDGLAAWRRLRIFGRPRATKANVLGALLAIALGVGIATQVQLTNERGLSELSQTDLVRVLDDISLRSSRLDQQIRELEATRDQLRSGTGTTADALDQAQHRADTLGILAGTIGAQGPGITVDISDPNRKVSGPLVLDLIQELRDAGAESIEVGGVRVVASSFVGDEGGDLSIDGQAIDRPIHIKAIGDSNTLASAMTIPGGIVESIRQKGARASVLETATVEITALHKPRELTYAHPTG